MATTRQKAAPKTAARKKQIIAATQTKAAKAKGEKKTTRCWPGYEPVPGKKPFSKGSCRKIKS